MLLIEREQLEDKRTKIEYFIVVGLSLTQFKNWKIIRIQSTLNYNSLIEIPMLLDLLAHTD